MHASGSNGSRPAGHCAYLSCNFNCYLSGVGGCVCHDAFVARTRIYVVCLSSDSAASQGLPESFQAAVWSQQSRFQMPLLQKRLEILPSFQQSWKCTKGFPKRKIVFQSPPVNFHDCWREGMYPVVNHLPDLLARKLENLRIFVRRTWGTMRRCVCMILYVQDVLFETSIHCDRKEPNSNVICSTSSVGMSACFFPNSQCMARCRGGIRILSRPLQAVMRRAMCSIGIKVPDLAVSFAGDFWASVVTSILSAPMNQLYSFAIISTEYHAAAPLQKLVVAGRFLSESYLTWAEDGSLVGLSSTFFRDLFMRCLYLATLMSLFAVVERMLSCYWVGSLDCNFLVEIKLGFPY